MGPSTLFFFTTEGPTSETWGPGMGGATKEEVPVDLDPLIE